MNEAELLLGLAEVALAVAGFSGIFYALSPEAKRTPTTLALLIYMICNSLVVVVQALVAIYVAYALTSPWQWASTISIFSSVLAIPLFTIVIPNAIGTRDLDISRFFVVSVWTISLLQLVFHLLNSPLLGNGNFATFFLAECMLIFISLITFVYLIVRLASITDEKRTT